MLSTTPARLAASGDARWARLRPFGWTVLLGAAVYGVLAPVLAITHELIVLGSAHLIGDLTWFVTTSGLLRVLPLDPIYTSAMLLTLGGIEPRGLALATSAGQLLHDQWPLFFQSPDLLAPDAWAGAVVAPGSTIMSRWLCGIVADAGLVLLGLFAIRKAIPGRRWLLVAGASIQAHVIVTHLIDSPPVLADVEAAGIPFAVAMLMSGDVQAGPRLAETLEAMSTPVQNIVLGLGMTILVYLLVLALMVSAWAVRSVCQPRRLLLPMLPVSVPFVSSPSFGPSRPFGSYFRLIGPASFGRMVALSTLALAVALSPLGDLADARTHFLTAAAEDDLQLHDLSANTLPLSEPPRAVETAGSASDARPADTSSAAVAAPQASTRSLAEVSPSVVVVSGSGYRYQYTVNGVPQVIRGIGYNVRYRTLPLDERVRRLDRDFALLQKAGVNTVFGWEPAEFDSVLLDVAQRHGLGVALSFEMDPEAAYADPAVRQRITRDVLDWVALHRAHPSLRMWAIGNEVLHKLVYPSWMPMRSDAAWEQRAREFAAFYVQLIDKVHAADPDHPVIHRDAEDAYLTWLRDAMHASLPQVDVLPRDAQADARRPWFIYGVNSYTPRLAQILTSWPSQDWDVPLFVSEFAPGGMSPSDRPQGLREMWKMIRRANGWVLGGSVYAWTTDGPEEVDRVFGLTDQDGQPVDGAFAAISAVYRGAARQVQAERISPEQATDQRVWTFARYVVRAVQEGRSVDLLPTTATSSIMGDVNNISKTPPVDSDLTIQRVHDPRRIAWSQETGVVGEWWVTWQPPATPNRKLMFVLQEHQDGTLGVQYIYHGPR